MDPASMMLAALFVSAVVTRLPQALADHHEAKKAAQAGEWDHLKDLRAARDSASAARAARRQQWAERIYDDWQARDRGEKRPGFFAWLSEVWHGAWEDALERRAARRGVRDPFDPNTPTRRDRAWQWGKARADQWKQKRARTRHRSRREPWWRRWADWARGWWARRRGKPTDPDPGPSDDPGPESHPDTDGPDRKPWWQQCMRRTDNGACGAPPAPGDIYCPPHAAEADKWQAKDDQQDTATNGTNTSTGSTNDGGPEMTAAVAAEEVQTNEAARRSLERIEKAAADLAEAAAQAEAAKAVIMAEGAATGDAMSVKAFDAGATQAVANINDIVNSDNLSAMHAAADEIGTAAKAGLKSLEKWKDPEAQIAEENIDPSTLASTQS